MLEDMNHNIWDSIPACICNLFWFIKKKTGQKVPAFYFGSFHFWNPLLVTKLQFIYDQNSMMVYLYCQVPVKATLLCNTDTY